MGMPELTQNQLAALSPGGKLILAGAGSGKTTVLTAKYVQLLSDEMIEPRQIVATTFTRKAAANLQTKIYTELLERQRNDKTRAEHWRRQRELMPWARIGTIHSICTKLIRAFPLEAGVDPEFTVRERNDEKGAAIDRRFRELARSRDPGFSALLEAFGNDKDFRKTVEFVLKRPDIVSSLLAAREKPEEATAFLEEAVNRGRTLFREESGDPTAAGHERFIVAANQLLAVVEPLLAGSSDPVATLRFDDIEFHTLRLLEGGGEVVQRIRDSIKHLLVDEFQDTSARQWKIIRSLVGDSEGGLLLDKLTLVGDDKQSIYSFRAADVTVVSRAREAFAASGKPESDWLVRLDDNFRTVGELLRPINETFDRLLPNANSNPLPFEAVAGPLSPSRETPDGLAPGAELMLGINWGHEEVFSAIAKRLKREIGTKKIVDPEDRTGKTLRPLRAEDVGVLFRSRTRLDLLENALREEGVPYRVVGGRGFLEKQEVLDLIHLLAALSDPRDMMALVGVLRSPLLNCSDMAVAALFAGDEEPLSVWRAVGDGGEAGRSDLLDDGDRENLKRGWTLWKRWRQGVENRSPAELLLTALEESGALAAYATGIRGQQRIANIYQFINRVREFISEGSFTLRRLVERIHLEKEAPEDDSQQEAEVDAAGGVALMTIHGAKGLEFPYVILPDLANKGTNTTMKDLQNGHLLVGEGMFSALADPAFGALAEAVSEEGEKTIHHLMKELFAPAEERAERLRLAYVAATRARDHLLLTSAVKTKSKSEALEIAETSHLHLWFEGVGISYSPEGLVVEDGVGNLLVRQMEKEVDLALGGGGKSVINKDKMRDSELPQIVIRPPANPDRWVLPYSAFSTWIVDPTPEATLRLVWFAGEMEKSGEAAGEQQEEGVLFAREKARRIGDLVHQLYQRHGPGCAWEGVADEVWDTLGAWSLEKEEIAVIAKEVEAQLQGGRKIGLHEIPKEAKRELPLRLQVGKLVLRGQADLAWREGDEVRVLDYKTTRLDNGEAPADSSAKHGYDHQSILYGLSLMRAWGLKKAVCRVAYLEKAEVVEYTVTERDIRAYEEYSQLLARRWQEAKEGLLGARSGE